MIIPFRLDNVHIFLLNHTSYLLYSQYIFLLLYYHYHFYQYFTCNYFTLQIHIKINKHRHSNHRQQCRHYIDRACVFRIVSVHLTHLCDR